MHYKKELLAIIEKELPLASAYLFGSRARGTHNPGSDIDIAIDAEAPIDWAVLGILKEKIEASDIPLFVDIVDLNNISKEMKNQILRDVIIWK